MVWLSLVLPAWAELAVCFNAVDRVPGQQFYWGMRDPSVIATETHCTLVTKASGQTEAQLALIHGRVMRPAPFGDQPATRYLKVVPDPPTPGGLAVLMDAAEMDAVDAYTTSQAAPGQVARQELRDNPICKNHTLVEISDYWMGAAPSSQKSILMAEIAKVDNLIATWDTKITPLTAGAPKDAMVAARNASVGMRDALQTQFTMYVTHEDQAWRAICSGIYLRQ
jgi:hypothetical protein